MKEYKITREINGESVDITLTDHEMFIVASCFVQNYMEREMIETFEIPETVAANLAELAYDMYASGDEELTEYECIERVVNTWKDCNNLN